MRSRYTAYTLLREDYLLATWHSSTRPEKLELATDPVKWIGLKILNCEAGQAADTRGAVTFEARYKVNGKAHKMRETSQFVFEDDHWFYVSGTHAQ